jgi:hypothetical protein
MGRNHIGKMFAIDYSLRALIASPKPNQLPTHLAVDVSPLGFTRDCHEIALAKTPTGGRDLARGCRREGFHPSDASVQPNDSVRVTIARKNLTVASTCLNGYAC